MVKLPKGAAMLDTVLPSELIALIEGDQQDHVWVVEDMSELEGLPWLHVFATAPMALIALGAKLKLTIIRAEIIPLRNTWMLRDSEDNVIGVLYRRPVHVLPNIHNVNDLDEE